MASQILSNPSSLLPYPQMIMEAIDAVKEAEGANESTISNHMESKHGELGATHSDLLKHHLSAMSDSGELLLVNNNYLRPISDAPPKRGRGRPPKAKEVAPAGAVIASPRPRGRPKKDPNAPPASKKPKTSAAPPSGRPRGRPKKVQPLQTGVEA